VLLTMSDLVLNLRGTLGLCPEVIGYLAGIKEMNIIIFIIN
jgi:hypothetical protein